MITSVTFSFRRRKIHINVLREKIDLIIDETLMIFQKFVKFQNQFSKELIKNLTTHKNCDHVINLKNNEFLYNFLYNLSNTKLITLRDYLNDVLTKK